MTTTVIVIAVAAMVANYAWQKLVLKRNKVRWF